jgi:AcrR family transcriptional regulator
MGEHGNSTKASSARRWGAGQRIDDPGRGRSRSIAAAIECFSEDGVAATKIERIAQTAGISRRTFYRYFDTKEALILTVVEEQAKPFFEEMRESLEVFSTRNFHQMVIHCVLFAIEKGPQMEGHELLLGGRNAAATADFYLRSARMKNILGDMLLEPFERAQKGGELDSNWRLDDLLNWTGRLIYSFIQHPEPIEDVERMVAQFLLPGVNTIRKKNSE